MPPIFGMYDVGELRSDAGNHRVVGSLCRGFTVSRVNRVVGSMLQVACAAVASVFIGLFCFIRLFYLIGLFWPIDHLCKTLLQFTSEWFGCNRDRKPIICSRHAFVP